MADITIGIVSSKLLFFSSCSTCGDKGGKPVAYIASTIRNPQTYKLFLNKLSKYGFRSCCNFCSIILMF